MFWNQIQDFLENQDFLEDQVFWNQIRDFLEKNKLVWNRIQDSALLLLWLFGQQVQVLLFTKVDMHPSPSYLETGSKLAK